MPGFAGEVASRVLTQLNRPLRFAARMALLPSAVTALLVLTPLAVLPTASTSSPPRCASTSLSVTAGAGGQAAGSTYHPLVFRNTSARLCTLYGYPGVSFLWPDGRQAGGAASRDPEVVPSLVTLRPGGDAAALLRVSDPGNWPPGLCDPRTVFRLRVYPPGSHFPLVLRFSAVMCALRMPEDLGSPLSVTAVAGSLP